MCISRLELADFFIENKFSAIPVPGIRNALLANTV
jgi:hypothetical protein